MKVLVIGSGGREHAVIRKLKENREIDTIWCAPGNGGISADAVCVDIKAMDKEGNYHCAKCGISDKSRIFFQVSCRNCRCHGRSRYSMLWPTCQCGNH